MDGGSRKEAEDQVKRGEWERAAARAEEARDLFDTCAAGLLFPPLFRLTASFPTPFCVGTCCPFSRFVAGRRYV
eukprot:2195597-Rhodomonas_salina.4